MAQGSVLAGEVERPEKVEGEGCEEGDGGAGILAGEVERPEKVEGEAYEEVMVAQGVVLAGEVKWPKKVKR